MEYSASMADYSTAEAVDSNQDMEFSESALKISYVQPDDSKEVSSMKPGDNKEISSVKPDDNKEISSVKPDGSQEISSVNPADSKELSPIKPDDNKEISYVKPADSLEYEDPDDPTIEQFFHLRKPLKLSFSYISDLIIIFSFNIRKNVLLQFFEI